MKKISQLFDKAVFRLAQATAPVDQVTPHELGTMNLGEKDYAKPTEEKGFVDLWQADQYRIGPPI